MAEQRGFTAWLIRLFKRRRPQPRPNTEPATVTAAVTPEVSIEPPSSEDTIAVPALGDVFDLHLVADFRWSSNQMSQSRLEERVKDYEEGARQQLRRRLWSRAREFEPTATAEAEQSLNAEVADGWCYDDESGTIRCSPRVRVRLDPRLLEQRLPFRIKQLDLEEEHELGMLRAEKARILTEAWLDVVRALELLPELRADERQFLVPFAASLADQSFAAVMRVLADVRRTRTVELHQVLELARAGHEQAGLFEFATAYDKALQAFVRQMGLDPYASFGAVESTS